MSPAVSVVIPMRNRAQLIGRAVASVQAQDVQDWEIVVADDGSTDDSARVVGELATRDERIRLVRLDRNRGAQAARNAGIRAARGEWIAFLDSDDEWLPFSLSARLEAGRESGAGAVHSECLIIRHPDPTPRPFGIRSYAGNITVDVLTNPGPMFQSLLVRKKHLECIGGLDESILSYQEWETSIRLASACEFVFLPQPTFIYHCHGGETISKDRLREAVGYRQVVRKHRREIIRHAGWKALAVHYLRISRFYRAAGRPLPALWTFAAFSGAALLALPGMLLKQSPPPSAPTRSPP